LQLRICRPYDLEVSQIGVRGKVAYESRNFAIKLYSTHKKLNILLKKYTPINVNNSMSFNTAIIQSTKVQLKPEILYQYPKVIVFLIFRKFYDETSYCWMSLGLRDDFHREFNFLNRYCVFVCENDFNSDIELVHHEKGTLHKRTIRTGVNDCVSYNYLHKGSYMKKITGGCILEARCLFSF
jgi:hypothetical protein